MSKLGIVSNLEEMFFYQEDQKLQEKYKAMQKMQETKQALSEVSGITDDLILQKFIDLNIRPETIASIALVPVIEIAWADGRIDEKEKTAILKSLKKFGWDENSIDYVILNQWMKRKPQPDLLEAWKHYIKAICEKMNEEEVSHLRKEIISHAKIIATASGGFLGFGSVSKPEKEMIKVLDNAFNN